MIGWCIYGSQRGSSTSHEDSEFRLSPLSACWANFHQAIESLESQTDLPFEVYDQVVAEPTEDSWRDAIAWARKHDFSHFLAYVNCLMVSLIHADVNLGLEEDL
jgi:hypothetical protein